MPISHYPLGHTLTRASLASSLKAVIRNLKETYWIYPPDKSQGNVLYKDACRGAIKIEGRNFYKEVCTVNQTPSEELLREYLLNLGFTSLEIKLLEAYYQQPLQEFPLHLLNTAFSNEFYNSVTGIQSAPPLLKRNYIANIYKKNNKIYCDVVVDNIALQHWPEDGDISNAPVETIPGEVTAHYVLTDQGFLFEHIETTNTLLSDLIKADGHSVVTQAQIVRANEEHELYLAEKTLYDALASGKFSRAQTFVGGVILDEVIAQSKKPETNLVVLIETLRFVHRFIKSPDMYLNCPENFETCKSVIEQLSDYSWGIILGNLLLVLVGVGLGLSLPVLLTLGTTVVSGVSGGIASTLSILSVTISSANIYHEARRKLLAEETLLHQVHDLIEAREQSFEDQEVFAPESMQMG